MRNSNNPPRLASGHAPLGSITTLPTQGQPPPTPKDPTKIKQQHPAWPLTRKDKIQLEYEGAITHHHHRPPTILEKSLCREAAIITLRIDSTSRILGERDFTQAEKREVIHQFQQLRQIERKLGIPVIEYQQDPPAKIGRPTV